MPKHKKHPGTGMRTRSPAGLGLEEWRTRIEALLAAWEKPRRCGSGEAMPQAHPQGIVHLEAVRELMSNKSISYKSLKVWQATNYPVSPFLALPRI